MVSSLSMMVERKVHAPPRTVGISSKVVAIYRHGPWTRTGEAARWTPWSIQMWAWSLKLHWCCLYNWWPSNGALDVCREVECLYNHPSRHINTYAIGINNYNATVIRCLSNSEEVVFGFESLNEFEGYLKNVTMRLLTPVNIRRYNCLKRDQSLNP